MEDTFIREHIEDLLRNIRTQVLIKLIKPYTRINITFISGELNIDPADVESLLVSCILDNTVRGRIDQVSVCPVKVKTSFTSTNVKLRILLRFDPYLNFTFTSP